MLRLSIWSGLLATIIFTAGVDSSCAQFDEDWSGAGSNAAPNAADNLGWQIELEVRGVLVTGNTISRTGSLSGSARHHWANSSLTFKGGGLRTESTLTSRYAVGTPEEFEVGETKKTETTAEAYSASSSYDYKFSESGFAVAGVDWLRNTFSGIDNRFLFGFGAGNTWVANERVDFNTTLGFTYTLEQAVVEKPAGTGKFPGLRFGYDFEAQLSTTTDFVSIFAGDLNLNNSDDIRIDWRNSLQVSMSSLFDLKPSVRLLWRNEPALTEVPLMTPDGSETGNSVFVPLGKVDTFVTLAIVVKL